MTQRVPEFGAGEFGGREAGGVGDAGGGTPNSEFYSTQTGHRIRPRAPPPMPEDPQMSDPNNYEQ